MATETNRASREDLRPAQKQDKAGRNGWAQEHGGLIFLIIVVSVISFVILYDSFVQ